MNGLDWQWRTRDFIVVAALAVPLGIFWGVVWGNAWAAADRAIPDLGYFMDGFFVVVAVLTGYVVRKPGSALLGELIAALVEMPFSPFGVVVLMIGLLQGLGVEAVFLAARYRNFSLPVLLLAGAAGSLVMMLGYYYVVEGWLALAPQVQALRWVLKLVGGAVLGGLVAKLIGDALVQTGVLNNFPIARARAREV